MELEFTGNMSKELKSCYDKRMEISKVWNLEINEKKSLLLKSESNINNKDSYKTKCFKIANYICSRLCDKIEK